MALTANKSNRLFSCSSIIVLLVFMSLISSASAKEESSSLKEMLAVSDSLYSEYLLTKQPECIIKSYNILMACDATYENCYSIKWRLSRTINEYGWHVDNSVNTWRQGLSLAKEAIELEPNNYEGYLWCGILHGQIGRAVGFLNALSSVKQMRDCLEKVVEIEPKHAYAQYILSLLYRQVPSSPLSFGNKTKALELAQSAVFLEPESPNLWWGLYEAQIAAGKRQKARETLEIIVEMPEYDPFNHLYNQPHPSEIKEKAEFALSRYK